MFILIKGYFGKTCGEECPEGLWGRQCLSRCLCENGAKCDVATGHCNCTAGWMAQMCDQRKLKSKG